MTVVFEGMAKDNVGSQLSIELDFENKIVLHLTNTDIGGKENLDKYTRHEFNKKELSNFIGSLLHIQSTVNRNK